jgi:hypothetical protein
VSFGLQQKGRGWFDKNKSDIESGRIATVELKRFHSDGKSEYTKIWTVGYYCYLNPEGLFFDPPGHCYCFCLDGHSVEDAGKLSAHIVALRKNNTDPQSYESADESRPTAPWLSKDEKLEFKWIGKVPPRKMILRLLSGLGAPLAPPLSDLSIYLTNHRLIIEAVGVTDGVTEVEIADFPVDCVRELKWNVSSYPWPDSLEIITEGPWTQSNSTGRRYKRTLGNGTSLNLPTSHCAIGGGWVGFLTGHWGRQFVAFDPKAPGARKMVEILMAKFKKPTKPPIMPQ